MHRTVAEHIHGLENKRVTLTARLMEEKNRGKRNQLEAELRAIESAITLFRSALETEGRLSPE